MRHVDRLLFVFDADSSLLDAMVDSARKLLRIQGCALCEVTHGLVAEKSEWRACKDALGAPVDYVHRDEMSEQLRQLTEGRLPCVVAEVGGESILLLDRKSIARCRGSVEDLRGKLLFHASKHDLVLTS